MGHHLSTPSRDGGGPLLSHQEAGASGGQPPGGAIELLLRSPVGSSGFWAFLENLWKTLDFLPRNGWGAQAFAIPGNTAPVTPVALPDSHTYHVALSALQASLNFLEPGWFLLGP